MQFCSGLSTKISVVTNYLEIRYVSITMYINSLKQNQCLYHLFTIVVKFKIFACFSHTIAQIKNLATLK